jgi:uncharacterized repeat protein (TIGR03806 family)
MTISAFTKIPAATSATILFFSTVTPGTMAQLIRQPNSTLNLSPDSPPPTLSATGAFADLATLTPNQGIVPYAPNVSFWSDYAEKSRWFCVPDLVSKITFSADGNWTLPTGMVWIKQFNLPNERTNPEGPSRRIETRFLVKTSDDIYGLTYAWRDDQTDADLVPDYGMDTVYDVTVKGTPTTQLWHYPARYQCMECHSAVAGYSLGFNTRQMNGSHVYGAQTLNQIQALSDAGYFSAPVSGVHNLPALAKATDTTQSLEWRVRSYFAANCLQCHQPGGEAYTNWDARPTTPTDFAQIIRGMLVYDADDSNNRFIVPGETRYSMVLKRLNAEISRMPPIASTEINPEAIQLITDWINQVLPARLSFKEWQTRYFGSPENPAAAPTADPDRDGQSNMEEFLANTYPTDATSLFAQPRGLLAARGTQVQFSFTQPANRAALVETSTDLVHWSLWDATGNSPSYPTLDQPRIFIAPIDIAARHFRLQLSSP